MQTLVSYSALNSSLLKHGSRMAKKIQYITTNKTINVNEVKTILFCERHLLS